MTTPCPSCGSLACVIQSRDRCRHTGKDRKAIEQKAIERPPIDKMLRREQVRRK